MDLRSIQRGEGGAVGAIARTGLAALAGAFVAAAAARRATYALGLRRVHRLGVRVVSVGNLVAGGTGKTPAVAWFARLAQAAGRRPGILSRGYGPRPAGSLRSDEGALLDEWLGGRVPQVEDPDRVRGARALLAGFPATDLVLLDDGFQHLRLARDADVVLVDATNPFGYGHRLPRGLLREAPEALSRADAVLVTRAERALPAALDALRAEVRRLAPRALVATARTRPTGWRRADGGEEDLARLAGTAVFAYAGIGNPDAFEAALTDVGARVVGRRFAPDHHRPTPAELGSLLAAARSAGAARVVTTRKDLVKLRPLSACPPDLAALDVAFEVTDGADALLALALGR